MIPLHDNVSYNYSVSFTKISTISKKKKKRTNTYKINRAESSLIDEWYKSHQSIRDEEKYQGFTKLPPPLNLSENKR